MGARRDRAEACLRIALGTTVASITVLAALFVTAPRPIAVDPLAERARCPVPDQESCGRVVGLEGIGLGAVVGLSLGLGAAAGALALRRWDGRPAFAPDRP